MAMIKVFSVDGVKELSCFDTLDNVEYITEDVEEIVDDGELTIGNPLE